MSTNHNGNGLSQIMTLAEVAELLRVSKYTLYKLIKNGDGVPCFRLGADYRFRRASVDAWMAKREAAVRRNARV